MAQMERDVIKTLNKLFAAGAVSEKDVSALTVQDMLELPGITVTEMKIITQLQEAIRKKAVIRYLSGADEEKEDTHGEEKDDAAEERDKGGDGTAAIYEDPSDDEGNGFSF